MIPQINNLFCIIVHFGFQQPIKSLVRQLTDGKVAPKAIIIVNNGPNVLTFPSTSIPIRVISTGENLGYGAALNKGLKVLNEFGVVPDDVVVCSNNDISVSSTSIGRLLSWWKSQKQPVLAAVKLGYVHMATGRTHVGGDKPLFARPYAHGSCLLASMSTWQKIGPISASYFMYWEDVALSMRAQSIGISIQKIPDVGITHDDTVKPLSGNKLYLLVRNGAHFLETLPGAWKIYWRFINVIRYCYHRLLSHTVIAQALADRHTL